MGVHEKINEDGLRLYEIVAYDALDRPIADRLVSAPHCAYKRLPAKFWNQCDPSERRRLHQAHRVTFRLDQSTCVASNYSPELRDRFIRTWTLINRRHGAAGLEVNEQWSLLQFSK